MEDKINFLLSFKGKTVDEVIALLKEDKQKLDEKQTLRRQKLIEYYRNCIGKYFVIQHNNIAFTLVHIMETPKGQIRIPTNPCEEGNPLYFLTWECYNIILSDQPRVESNAAFNILWLNNPYEDYIAKSTTCKEINKEEFEKITSSFNSFINITKQILK